MRTSTIRTTTDSPTVDEQIAKTNPTVKFSSPDTDADGLIDGWEVNFFIEGAETPLNDLATIIARQDGTGDPDADGSNNEAEETGGSDPTNIAIRPYDLDGDGLVDAWELQHFTNTTSQTGGGNADGDTFTNAQEQTAGSNPTITASTPDDTDGDGTPNSAETLVPYAPMPTPYTCGISIAPRLLSRTAFTVHRTFRSKPSEAEPRSPNRVLRFRHGAEHEPRLQHHHRSLPRRQNLQRRTDGYGDHKLGRCHGAFTFEALVRFDFDPLAVLPSNPPRMQILAAEDDNRPGSEPDFPIRHRASRISRKHRFHPTDQLHQHRRGSASRPGNNRRPLEPSCLLPAPMRRSKASGSTSRSAMMATKPPPTT